MNRRTFLAQATASAAILAAKGKKIPIGLELYSVRQELQKDDVGTVKAVAKMGYQAVEFYSPYTGWTVAKAKEMRKLLEFALDTGGYNTVDRLLEMDGKFPGPAAVAVLAGHGEKQRLADLLKKTPRALGRG